MLLVYILIVNRNLWHNMTDVNCSASSNLCEPNTSDSINIIFRSIYGRIFELCSLQLKNTVLCRSYNKLRVASVNTFIYWRWSLCRKIPQIYLWIEWLLSQKSPFFFIDFSIIISIKSFGCKEFGFISFYCPYWMVSSPPWYTVYLISFERWNEGFFCPILSGI